MILSKFYNIGKVSFMSNSENFKGFHPRRLARSSDKELNKQTTGLMTSLSYLRRLCKTENFELQFSVLNMP